MNLNSHIIKVTGTAELDQPLELGRRYAIGLEAGITDERKVDREDGTFDIEYKAKLIRAAVKADNGQIIQTKDKTQESVKTRLRILDLKTEFRPDMDDDSFYKFIQGGIRYNMREIIRMIIKQSEQ